MRKTLTLVGVLALALAVTHGVAAGGKDCSKPCAGAAETASADNAGDSVVKTVGAQTPTCHRAAAKAAYDETLAATGCEKSTAISSRRFALASRSSLTLPRLIRLLTAGVTIAQ